MENLLPNDEDNLRDLLLSEAIGGSSEPKPFAATELIACPDCSRSNAPTRTSCLYCGAALLVNANAALQRPVLRPVEKWEHGYNNIRLPSAVSLTEEATADLAGMLKLDVSVLSKILSSEWPLPVARTANSDEALLVQRKLAEAGVESVVLSDAELGVSDDAITRVRSMTLSDAGFNAYQSPETPPMFIAWSGVALIVTGRVTTKRLEFKEQRARAGNQIVDSSEFTDDELVADIHTYSNGSVYRITSKTFDFSCLGTKKGFLAEENLKQLIELFREHAPTARIDSSYNSSLKLLENVWPAERVNESSGWRRNAPGRLTLGGSAVVTNYDQFTKYSRLRFRLLDRQDEK